LVYLIKFNNLVNIGYLLIFEIYVDHKLLIFEIYVDHKLYDFENYFNDKD